MRTFRRFFLKFSYFLIFLNIQIDLIILETDVEHFTLTTKKSLHIIFKISLRMGSGLSNTRFLGPTRVLNPNRISIGSAVFAQLTAECPYTLMGRPTSKLPVPMGIAYFNVSCVKVRAGFLDVDDVNLKNSPYDTK